MKKHLNHLFISVIILLGVTSSVAPVYAIEQAVAEWSSYTYLTSYTSNSQAGTCGGNMGMAGAFITNIGDGSLTCSVQNITLYADNVGSSGGWAVSPNDYLEYVFTVYNTGNANSSDIYFSDVRAVNNTIGLTVVDLEFQTIGPGSGLIKIITKPNTSGTLGAYTTFQNIDLGLRQVDVFKAIRLTKWNISQAGDNTAVVNAILINKSTIDEILVQLNWNNNLTNVQLEELRKLVASNNGTIEAINNINNDQQQAGEQAQADGETAANTAGTDAEQNTATMFSTLGEIVGVFKDTPAGDCTININFGTGRPNLGNLNFCQGDIEPIRPVIRAVIYLVMAIGTYKLLMWIVGAIAGLINWVQTGNGGNQ